MVEGMALDIPQTMALSLSAIFASGIPLDANRDLQMERTFIGCRRIRSAPTFADGSGKLPGSNPGSLHGNDALEDSAR